MTTVNHSGAPRARFARECSKCSKQDNGPNLVCQKLSFDKFSKIAWLQIKSGP